MSDACDGCMRRSYLLGLLATRIASLLSARPAARVPTLLGLDEEELVAAVAGPRTEEAKRFLETFDPTAPREDLERREIDTTCRHAATYPAGLRDLADPPAVLFHTGAGELGELTAGPAVAIVGTRDPSPYGNECAMALGRGLGAAGVTVVSGLARGIDGAAHRGALAGAGPCLGVLAGGVDVPYPRRHRPLIERVKAAGLVVSELPPGTQPLRWSFPARNRLMAALAQLTVVVEAADPSGSLITAVFAQDLGRTVGAVPGRVTFRRAAGSNGLLADGAMLIAGPADILDELFGAGSHPREDTRLEPWLRRLLDGVEAGEGVASLAGATGETAARVRAGLVELELRGLVRRGGLGDYERTVGGGRAV